MFIFFNILFYQCKENHMWQNFYTSQSDLGNVLKKIQQIKKDLFDVESIRVKEYFAQKVTIAFDNLMIFHAMNGLDSNMRQAFADSQNEMLNSDKLFLPIYLYLVPEKSGYSLLVKNAKEIDILVGMCAVSQFEHMGEMEGQIKNWPKFENDSFSTLAFHFSLVDYSRSWINYTPALEERARLQADHILFLMTFKKVESNLYERVAFMEAVRRHPNYQELLSKILKKMPRLEADLEKQWRLSSVVSSGEHLINK